MLNVNRADVDQMLQIIDYLLRNENKVTIEKLLEDCHLTFDEYRLISALAMPAVREHNAMLNMKSRAAYYKGLYVQCKNECEKTDEIMRMAKDYLDRRFAPKQQAVIRTAEQEAEDRGDCDDTCSAE